MKTFVSRSLATVILVLAAGAANGQETAAAAVPANPYTPPACVSGVPFADITCTTGFDPWIEKFAADGITAGCGGGNYCPGTPVTRDQMAVFIERAMHGTATWSPGDAGNANTFLGAGAGSNTTGNGNTATGSFSLPVTTTGYSNTAYGHASLYSNGTGHDNTAIGESAGAVNTSGTENTFLGAYATAAADYLFNATAIGWGASVDASYHVRIGDATVTQIGGQVAWSNLSDARAKNDIRDLDLGLDFVMQLRPVSFTLKQGNGRTDMGFVAQDVEALVGDEYNVLGVGGDRDRTLSLRYTDLIAPMVKAIQEQQTTIAAQQTDNASLKAQVATQQAQIEALRAALAERNGAVERRLAALEQRKP